MIIKNYCRNQLCIHLKNAVFALKSTHTYHIFKNMQNGTMLHNVFCMSQTAKMSGKRCANDIFELQQFSRGVQSTQITTNGWFDPK